MLGTRRLFNKTVVLNSWMSKVSLGKREWQTQGTSVHI